MAKYYPWNEKKKLERAYQSAIMNVNQFSVAQLEKLREACFKRLCQLDQQTPVRVP